MAKMSTLTEKQQEAKERSLIDVTAFIDFILLENPTYTGKIELNFKDGVILDFWSHRRYSVFDHD